MGCISLSLSLILCFSLWGLGVWSKSRTRRRARLGFSSRGRLLLPSAAASRWSHYRGTCLRTSLHHTTSSTSPNSPLTPFRNSTFSDCTPGTKHENLHPAHERHMPVLDFINQAAPRLTGTGSGAAARQRPVAQTLTASQGAVAASVKPELVTTPRLGGCAPQKVQYLITPVMLYLVPGPRKRRGTPSSTHDCVLGLGIKRAATDSLNHLHLVESSLGIQSRSLRVKVSERLLLLVCSQWLRIQLSCLLLFAHLLYLLVGLPSAILGLDPGHEPPWAPGRIIRLPSRYTRSLQQHHSLPFVAS